MRTKGKILQHNKLDASSFFQYNFKNTIKIAVKFFEFTKNVRDARF